MRLNVVTFIRRVKPDRPLDLARGQTKTRCRTMTGNHKLQQPQGAHQCGHRVTPSSSRTTCRNPCRRSRSWRSEEHTSELQSLMRISYAVFCLKKKKKIQNKKHIQ